MTRRNLHHLIKNKSKNNTLQLFKVGCDTTNFKILELVTKKKSITMEELEEKLGLASKTLYNRTNAMIKVGLLKRHNGTVMPGEMLPEFKELIDNIIEKVENHIYSFLEEET